MHSLLIALALLAATPQAPVSPAVPLRLALDVVAVGRDGAPVADLKTSEFEVWLSGFRVPIEEVAFVTPDSMPRTIVLLLDNAAVGPDLAPRVQQAARVFVKGLGDGDRVAVVPLYGAPTALTTERARLLQAIDGYRPRAIPFRVEDAGEHVLRTIVSWSRQMMEQPGHRKAIVAIGAVWLFDTPLPAPGLRNLHQEWIAAMRATAAANASLYVIDPVGLAGQATRPDAGTNGLAHETGGHAFVNTNDIARAGARILSETGTYYVLRIIDPPVQRTADLRELEVRVLRKGVTVRARRGIPGRR